MFTGIIKHIDGSYEVLKNGHPYHVPNKGEWAEEWAAVHRYAIANPGEVTLELPQPAPTLEELKANAIAAIKEKSWLVETGGITLQGMAIPTDRESQAMVTGAVVGTLLNPSQVTRWQTAGVNPDGTPVFIGLDGDTIKYIGMAVRQHVQACFDLRDVKCAAVAKLETVDAVNEWLETELNADWPE